VYISKKIPTFLGCDTALQDACRTAPIKLLASSINHKGLGPASDPSSLGLVRREFPSNKTIEVWNTPVRLEVGWWWRVFRLHDVSSSRGGFCLRWGFKERVIDPLYRTKVDGRLVKVPLENIRWNHGFTRCDFCKLISSLIISPCDMVKLEAVELVLQAPYFLAIGLHLRIMVA
jgi:hypothetical protein